MVSVLYRSMSQYPKVQKASCWNLFWKALRNTSPLILRKEDLEVRIANEQIAKPKLTEDHLLHFLLKFRVLDMSKQSHRQRLIDTFVNRIYLYDDKLVITFNHKDGAETITLNDIESALAEAENGSDLVSFAVPTVIVTSEFIKIIVAR